jgi:hypothetical protein
MASGHRVPHQRAAHMAAPTEGQSINETLANGSRPHMAQRGHWDIGSTPPGCSRLIAINPVLAKRNKAHGIKCPRIV